MSFWTTQAILENGPDIIEPFNSAFAAEGAYPLKMGHQAVISSDPPEPIDLNLNPSLSIPSGQFALLLSEERIKLPKNALAFISLKTRLKKKGLINISGFHVDPGYEGRLKFWVYNAGNQSILLQRGDHAFAIWFSSLDKNDSKPFARNCSDNDRITSEDLAAMQGSRASPAALKADIEDARASFKQEIEKLRLEYQNKYAWVQATFGIALTMLFVLVGLVLDKYLVEDSAPANFNLSITESSLNKLTRRSSEKGEPPFPEVHFAYPPPLQDTASADMNMPAQEAP